VDVLGSAKLSVDLFADKCCFFFLFGLFRRLCRLLVLVSVFVYLLIFFLSDSFFIRVV